MEKRIYKVEPGMYVEYAYTVKDAKTGELLFEAKPSRPDMMIFGVSHEVVPALAATMEGLKIGDHFEIELPPEAAFGERHEDDVLHLDRSIFEDEDGGLAEGVKTGAILPMMTADGQRVMGKILEIGDKVVMDFNHPFAGKTVEFKGEIINVRPATEEELHPVSGCGGCGGCSGGCHDGGCDDGNGSCGCDGCKK